MRKNKRGDSDSQFPSAPGWMTTYSDMVTLLLTFFVLLISFSTVNKLKFEMAAMSLKGAFGVMKKFPSPMPNRGVELSPESIKSQKDIMESIKKIQQKAKELGVKDQVSIQVTDQGLLIRMGEKILFDLGKADLRPEAYPILNIIGETIKNSRAVVLVSGHTDNLPIRTVEFPSNWELSTARAVRVVRYLVEGIGVDPTLLGAAGYSEYQPVAPNDSPENRQKNRRVEFLITWQKQ